MCRWLCHRRRDKKREPETVSHLCDTQSSRVSGWFVPLRFLLSTSLPRQAREGLSSACVLLLFIHLLSESTLPLPIPAYFLSLLPVCHIIHFHYPVFSHLCMFGSFPSPFCFCFPSLTPSFCFSVFVFSCVDSVER